MGYIVCFKDISVFSIAGNGVAKILSDKFMPFDIWLDEETDIDTLVNNLINFREWCGGRLMNLDRKYAKEICNHLGISQGLTMSEKANVAIECRCLSLNDCYWVKRDNEDISWSDVNLFEHSMKDVVFEIALFGGSSLTVTNTEAVKGDLNTDGKAAKAWVRKDDGFYLLKANENDSAVKEVEASQILKELGLSNAGYSLGKYNEELVSITKCFSGPGANFVRAEWLYIWGLNHEEENIENAIYRFKEQFDKMNLGDFLIGNSDEHGRNWGFLYDDERNIYGINPHMDFDHAFSGSDFAPCLPMRFLGEHTKSQVEVATEIIKRHPEYIKFNVDLSKFKYGKYVEERLEVLRNELKNGNMLV